MGAIGGLLGLGGGANGSGFAAPTGTNIVQPTTAAQANTSYNANQALLQALQGQNGLGNQSQVYNQLQGVANGTGPNPAQAMLNQATGQNVANQASLAAGQRGAASNVGLLSRQAAQQGANLQQQAAGQGATMQANQSLGAINSMGNIANTQAGNLIGATQGEQQNLLNSLAGQNNANVSMQSNINSNNTSLANQLSAGQQGLIGGLMNGAASAMSSMASGGKVQNFDDGGGVEVTPISSTPAPNPVPVTPPSSGGGGGSSGGGGLSSLIGLAALLADGGSVPAQTPVSSQGVSQGPQSILGKVLKGVSTNTSGQSATPPGATSTGAGSLYSGASNLGSALFGGGNGQSPSSSGMAKGGKVPVKLSPQEKVLSPEKAKKFAKGGPMEAKTVPGKPKVPGKNDYANDTYGTELKPGTIIIPLESLHSNEDARKFVQATLAKRGKK